MTLEDKLRFIAKTENISYLDAITNAQAGAALLGDEKALAILGRLKWIEIEKQFNYTAMEVLK